MKPMQLSPQALPAILTTGALYIAATIPTAPAPLIVMAIVALGTCAVCLAGELFRNHVEAA